MIEWSVDPAYAEGAAAARFASLDDTFAVGGEQITSDKVSEVLRVTIDAGLLLEPGWHEIVVQNPEPLHPEIGLEWGNGTSNAAHLIVAFGDD